MAEIGEAYRRTNDPNDALVALRKGQAIMTRLVKISPENAFWKRVLAWLNEQIAALTKSAQHEKIDRAEVGANV